jgi:hypothetical protein
MFGFDLLFSETIKNFLKLGFKNFETSEDARILRVVLAERLLREIKFNLEIINEFKKGKEDFLQEIDSRVVEGIFSQPLPISILFPDQIPHELLEKTIAGNKKHLNWMAGISTEADLIERISQRVAVAKCRDRNKTSSGDIQYLEKLMRCLKEALVHRVSDRP